jgi:hypothetical protein
MSNKKQTAVEWLEEQLRMQTPLYTKEQIIEIAKEIEKQQIIDSWDNGYEKGYGFLSSKFDNAEQYYNETFKQL